MFTVRNAAVQFNCTPAVAAMLIKAQTRVLTSLTEGGRQLFNSELELRVTLNSKRVVAYPVRIMNDEAYPKEILLCTWEINHQNNEQKLHYMLLRSGNEGLIGDLPVQKVVLVTRHATDNELGEQGLDDEILAALKALL